MEAAMQVSTIDQRKEIPWGAIQSVVNQIVAGYSPRKVILFGSYASGKHQPESDVDLLVVMDTKKSEVLQAVEIMRGIEYCFGLDLVVYTPQRLAQRLEWGDHFLREIMNNGKVLYESSDA
jgi:uncharacterized protein